MTTATTTKPLTYEEYLDTPEIEGRFDIVDGEIIMAAAPTNEHQETIGEFYFILRPFVIEHNLGKVLFAPLDIVIRRNPLRTRQPDLLLLSNESYARIDRHLPIEEAPELTIEILSPSNTRRRIQDVLADYAAIGVKECWLVSLATRTIEVLTLVNGEWLRLVRFCYICWVVRRPMRVRAAAALEGARSQPFVPSRSATRELAQSALRFISR